MCCWLSGGVQFERLLGTILKSLWLHAHAQAQAQSLWLHAQARRQAQGKFLWLDAQANPYNWMHKQASTQAGRCACMCQSTVIPPPGSASADNQMQTHIIESADNWIHNWSDYFISQGLLLGSRQASQFKDQCPFPSWFDHKITSTVSPQLMINDNVDLLLPPSSGSRESLKMKSWKGPWRINFNLYVLV